MKNLNLKKAIGIATNNMNNNNNNNNNNNTNSNNSHSNGSSNGNLTSPRAITPRGNTTPRTPRGNTSQPSSTATTPTSEYSQQQQQQQHQTNYPFPYSAYVDIINHHNPHHPTSSTTTTASSSTSSSSSSQTSNVVSSPTLGGTTPTNHNNRNVTMIGSSSSDVAASFHQQQQLRIEQIENAKKELKQVCVKLRRTGTDGRDKVKSFETLVIIAKTLKFDLQNCFYDYHNNNSNNNNHYGGTDQQQQQSSPSSQTTTSSIMKHVFLSSSSTATAENMSVAPNDIPPLAIHTIIKNSRGVNNNVDEEDEYASLTMDYVAQTMRMMLVHRSSYLRASAIRAIRYFCRYVESISVHFWKYHCHFHLCKMFDVDKKNLKEKKQVFDLMKGLSKVESDAIHIPNILVKAVASIAENPEDAFKFVATEILRDILIFNPKVVASSNGLRVLLSAVLDPKFHEISESIIQSFLYLYDDPSKRKFIRPMYDIQYLISPFTQGYVEDKKIMKEQLEASQRAICFMMKSWTGLVCLSERGVAVGAIVDALLLPEDEMRKEFLFDTIILILRGASPPHYRYLIPKLSTEERQEKDGKISHLNVLKPQVTQYSSVTQVDKLTSTLQGDNIIMNFLAMVILSFIDNGLLNALLTLSRVKDQHDVSQRSAQILQTILAFSDLLLSSDRCLQMHDLFDSVVAKELRNDELFASDRKRSKVLSMLTLYTQQTNQVSQKKDIPAELVKTLNSVSGAVDDIQFSQLIKESNVMTTKDDKKWNWEKIITLVFGPLRTPSRLLEAINQKFIRRLLGFYLPSSRLFSELPYKEDLFIYARVGEQLIENLLSTNDGCQFLRKCGFLDELRDGLQIELQTNPESNPNRTFSDERVTYKMSRRYFTFIGTLSASPQGVELLIDFKIFNALHKLTTTRDDICQLSIKALDFTRSKNATKPARSIIKQAMEKGSKKVRYFAISHMKRLLRESVDFHTWGIELLNNQLTDTWEDVVITALKTLVEACQEIENLDALTALRPSVEPLERQPDGKVLLLRLLSRPQGFFYLYEVGWIQNTMKDWMTSKNLEYVTTVEEALEKSMNDRYSKTGLSYSILSNEGISLPPHFFGELCKTNEGCDMLKESGHFNSFIQVLSDYETSVSITPRLTFANEEAKQNALRNLRAALWAIGHIGASDSGYQFIKEANCIERLINLAQNSNNLSLRGTCMYILGVMNKSAQAQEKISQLGWECHADPVTRVYVSVPTNSSQFFTIAPYEYEGSAVSIQEPYYPLDHHLPDILNESQTAILKQITLLANPVTEASATKVLKKQRQTSPNDFSPALFYFVFGYLSKYRYSLRTKKLIFQELFSSTSFTSENFEELDSLFIPKKPHSCSSTPVIPTSN